MVWFHNKQVSTLNLDGWSLQNFALLLLYICDAMHALRYLCTLFASDRSFIGKYPSYQRGEDKARGFFKFLVLLFSDFSPGGEKKRNRVMNSCDSSGSGCKRGKRGQEDQAIKQESRSKLILRAYKEKMAALDSIRTSKENTQRKIKSNTPVRRIDRNKIHKIDDHWWEKPPTVAGESMNSSQARLSDVEGFSQSVRDRVLHKVKDQDNFGEFCHDPIKARKLLMNLSYRDLTIPCRAADFRTGVEWRLTLRPNLSK